MLLPTGETGRQLWRYTTDSPAENWASPDFDDAGWRTGPGGFGGRETPNAVVSTKWTTKNIWLRTTVDLDAASKISLAHWRLYHDEDIEIYVNGTKVLALEGFEPNYMEVPLDKAAVEAFRPGKNTVAVHCRQTAGGQAVDVGLTIIKP